MPEDDGVNREALSDEIRAQLEQGGREREIDRLLENLNHFGYEIDRGEAVLLERRMASTLTRRPVVRLKCGSWNQREHARCTLTLDKLSPARPESGLPVVTCEWGSSHEPEPGKTTVSSPNVGREPAANAGQMPNNRRRYTCKCGAERVLLHLTLTRRFLDAAEAGEKEIFASDLG